ncbi:MAG: hypothetical protein IJ530_11090 [Treponema sp.]|uniref:Swt1 family HEPN domain-containing protein n=1 Tax=Treponema sp. TaxID=166 RepID=UPI0025CCF92F|nr:Swt1 family HEPN domain-containing protein [Treponema sp.]MBQ8680293.1 hypothetical protein [Treponema sp.]
MINNNQVENQLRAFGMSNVLLIEDLLQLQKKQGIDLGIVTSENEEITENYYPQFGIAIRNDAHKMSIYYDLFYCLERTVREIVSQTLSQSVNDADDWWNLTNIPENIKNDVENRIQREKDSGVTIRSENELDYTTFGELSTIISSNWTLFGSIFSSKKAVEKVMNSLNTLRGPIAHCSMLADDEIIRLKLTIRDWFRLME